VEILRFAVLILLIVWIGAVYVKVDAVKSLPKVFMDGKKLKLFIPETDGDRQYYRKEVVIVDDSWLKAESVPNNGDFSVVVGLIDINTATLTLNPTMASDAIFTAASRNWRITGRTLRWRWLPMKAVPTKESKDNRFLMIG